jgi:3-methyladenine DNA glycosylase AlkC
MKPTIERINLLNQGSIETKNLMEALAIDFNILLSNVVQDFKLPIYEKKIGITKLMYETAKELYIQKGFSIFQEFVAHPSNTIRGIACCLVVQHITSLKDGLKLMMPLADDKHFGVREWAWLALRPMVITEPLSAIKYLEEWVNHPSENIRRFACEITRPRGVWCAHIKELRQEPWLALSLLRALKSDPAKYVQLSVGNWLNDAGKDHPIWVKDICSQWQATSSSQATQKICKRAMRNLV